MTVMNSLALLLTTKLAFFMRITGKKQVKHHTKVISSPSILPRDLKFCEGVVNAGLAIDQTNGDIHFLNSTGPLREVITYDWSKWNIEKNLTTIVQ